MMVLKSEDMLTRLGVLDTEGFMKVLEWDDCYSIGVRELDFQHRQMVSLLNTSHDQFTSNATAEDQELTLVELVDYATYHINFERRWLKVSPTLDYIQRQYSADQLLHKVIKIHNYHYKRDKNCSLKILTFMSRWITKHIHNAKTSFADDTYAPLSTNE
jgi:hemerythrin